jgi:branched-chain amino acid aminotransferase
MFLNDSDLQAIWLTIPMPKAEMIAVTEEAVRRSGLGEAYIRHIVTRGVGDLGLDPRKCVRASVIIIVDTIALWPAQVYETGLRVITAGTPIPHREALSPRVKSLNYLPHIMAKAEGIVAGMDDVLMLDSAGFVAEASGCNIFVVKGNMLLAPPKSHLILPGITYDVVIELARAHRMPIEIRPISESEVRSAEELWLSSSTKEVLAITCLDGKPVGNGKPGPVWRQLIEAWSKRVGLDVLAQIVNAPAVGT